MSRRASVRRGLVLCAALFVFHTACVGAQEHASRTKAHVTALASDAAEGRATGSPGERVASEYIISELRRIGALPLPGLRDYRVPFDFTAGARDGGSSISVTSARDGRTGTFESRNDIQALSFSADATISAPVVFTGYGIVVPPNQGVSYDSYANLDVKDKIVVVLRYFPENADPKIRSVLARYSDLRYKGSAARQRGARGMIVIAGPRSPNAGAVIPMSFDSAISASGLVAVSIGEQVVRALFASPARTLEDAQRALDSGESAASDLALPGVIATVTASVVRETRSASNVVAYLPATGEVAEAEKPWIALGAHYDHLGRGQIGNSLADKTEARRIHHGADDNASGVAAVLAAAQALTSGPRRLNIMFGFWSGEEIGLLGSAAFVRAAPVPMDRIRAYLNFDMVGRMQDNRLIVQAVGTSPVWPQLLRDENVAAGFDLALQDDPYQPTDVASFNAVDVPTLNFFTGAHADYHRPSDTADKINYGDLDRIATFSSALAGRVEALAAPPAFVKVEQHAAPRMSRSGTRVFTGTIPDYSTRVDGLLVGGVIGGGPADKAGLQKGDVIVEVGERPIANVYDYMYVIDTLKPGQAVKVTYLRQSERRETLLTPAARN
jgi:hypothetical protein